METKTMKTICIMCPMGCDLTVEKTGETFKVAGNTCKRGETYGVAEMTAPIRMVTSLVKYFDSVAPVKTSAPVPKEKIAEVLAEIKSKHIKTKLQCGDKIISKVAGTEADIIVTGNL